MRIRKAELTDVLAGILMELSEDWQQKNSCHGYRKNTLEDIRSEDIFLAEEDGQTIGYLFCHTYLQERESPTVPRNSRCLEIEELYVAPGHRSKGIGRSLYRHAVSHYGSEISFVTLTTPTKNYKGVLHFYIEELGMDFWSARLFQKL